MTVKILNNDTVARTWVGQAIFSGAYYTIQSEELNTWANDSELLVAIADGYAIVNNGTNDLTDVNTAINLLKGITSEKRTIDGRVIMATTKPDYSEVKIFSHNFADKTSWYADSIRYNDEILIKTGSARYASDRRYWIDLTHGKVTQEDTLLESYNYRPIVNVYNGMGELLDGYVENDPHDGEGTFVINYKSGEVTFDDDVSPGLDGYVKACYNYATTSGMYITPGPGKQLDILRAEAQFTTDVIMKDSIVFETFIYSAVIEAMMGLPPGTLGPPGSRYRAQPPSIYKSAADMVAEANGNYPICPAFGGSSWRGMRHPTITLPFDYTATKSVKSSIGAQVKIYLAHDTAFEGTYGTVTFYCHSKDEE